MALSRTRVTVSSYERRHHPHPIETWNDTKPVPEPELRGTLPAGMCRKKISVSGPGRTICGFDGRVLYQMTAPRPDAESLWSPLNNPFFFGLWIAQAVSNIGTWMQSTGAAWLMTGLDPSPLMVALVQTASSIPIFFLGVAAGALADIVDRRLLLIFTQVWMLASALILAVLTFLGLTTPSSLLFLTFTLGLGSALMSPAFQAIFPELVPR
jgi:hypothetical protein